MTSARAVRAGAAVVAGLLLAVAFPPWGWWPLAVVSVAVQTLVCAGERVRWAALYGGLAGLVFFAVLVRWVAVVGLDAWIMLTLYSAAWLVPTAAATAVVTRVRGWVLWVPLVWVAQEALRDRIPLGGWPWGRLGFSQADAPWLPVAAWGGVAVLTFLVALSGAAVAWAVLAVRRRPLVAVAAGAAAVVLPSLLALLPVAAGGSGATVAVVQGDVPATGLGFAESGQRRAVLDNHVTQTLRLADAVRRGQVPAPQAVIWPENASDLDPYAQPDARSAITAAARAIGVPILVGAVIANPADPQTVLNVGIVWDPQTGPGERYVKQHPVPFGEYVPFRPLLADRIDRFALIPRDYAAGDRPGVLQVGPVTVGDVICFEVAYDDIVRDTVRAGARMLAVQTNNATYTGRGETEQQLAMARIRSVEQGRSVVVAATNGISAAFLPDGTEIDRLPESTAGFIVADLPQREELTVAARLGGMPELLAVIVAAAVVVFGFRRAPQVAQPGATTVAEGPGAPVSADRGAGITVTDDSDREGRTQQ